MTFFYSKFNFIFKAKNTAFIFLVIGIILRLIFPYDIEYKADQIEMLMDMQLFKEQGMVKYIGAQSSAGYPNFGLTNWIFYLISYITISPVGVSMILAIMNCFGLIYFYKITPQLSEKNSEIELWYYAFSLLSISLIPITLARNIWGPSLLSFFSFGIIHTFFTRKKSSKIHFILGALLILVSQIHLLGLVLNLIISCIVLFESFKFNTKKNGLMFIIGQVIFSIGMIPWIHRMYNSYPQILTINSSIDYIKDYKIIWHGIYNGFGLDLGYTLGKYAEIFLQFPKIETWYSYFYFIIYYLIFGIAIFSLILFCIHTMKIKTIKFNLQISSNQWLIIGFMVYSFTFLAKMRLFSHYYPLTYPFIYLLSIKLMRGNKVLIYLTLIFNLILSIGFIVFIHDTGGFIDSYFGKTYNSLL